MLKSIFDYPPHIQDAIVRCRKRHWSQRTGVPYDEVPDSIRFLSTTDSWLPYERDLAIQRGIKLTRKYGW